MGLLVNLIDKVFVGMMMMSKMMMSKMMK